MKIVESTRPDRGRFRILAEVAEDEDLDEETEDEEEPDEAEPEEEEDDPSDRPLSLPGAIDPSDYEDIDPGHYATIDDEDPQDDPDEKTSDMHNLERLVDSVINSIESAANPRAYAVMTYGPTWVGSLKANWRRHLASTMKEWFEARGEEVPTWDNFLEYR